MPGKDQNEKRVIFPVDMPKGNAVERVIEIQPPREKTDEQDSLFTIQVASFKLKKSAQIEADRLIKSGIEDAFVLPKGSYSIVCVGKFSLMAEAKRFSNRLKKRYNDCLVRRL